MSGYKSICSSSGENLITFRHPITEVYRSFLCSARYFCCGATFLSIYNNQNVAFLQRIPPMQLAITLKLSES